MAVGNAAGDLLYCKTRKGRPFTISIFTAATVDLYQKVATNGVAASTSPDRYRAYEDFFIYDIVALTATGKVEFEVDGRRTQVLVDFAGQQASNPGRPALMIPFNAGSDIMIRAATTLA